MGSPGSGKTTFAKTLSNDNTVSISCGDLYRQTHHNYPFLHQARLKGKEFWISALKKFIIMELQNQIGKLSSNITTCIIDGMWHDNLQVFQSQVGKINHIYYLKCTPLIAKQRLVQRHRSDDYAKKINSRVDQFFQREQHVLNTINNTGAPLTIVNQTT